MPQSPPIAITEAMIRDLVEAFYAEARRDPLLGPVFDAHVIDWDAHLTKICDFWSAVLLQTGRFNGRPMAVHLAISEIGPGHFDRWLQLFEEVAHARWPSDAADVIAARARLIGASLQRGVRR